MTDDRRASLRQLEDALSYRFHDIDLLDNALIHRSFVHENPHMGLQNNERLEFLGDAVLQLSISLLLMEVCKNFTEGQLSKLRASLVNEQVLSEIAMRFALGNYLLLGRGEELSLGRRKSSILADTFEAVMAAVFLDGSFDETHRLVRNIFDPLIGGETKGSSFRDYKTTLQELSLRKYREAPRYALVAEHGPEHNRTFEMKLSISQFLTTTGKGRSKKEAEQKAAKLALEIIDGLYAEAGD